MRAFYLFILALFLSLPVLAQDRTQDIETEFVQRFIVHLSHYAGIENGRGAVVVYNDCSVDFFETIRALVQRQIFAFDTEALGKELRKRFILNEWGKDPEAEKKGIWYLVKRFSLASTNLPQILSGRSPVETEKWNLEFEDYIRRISGLKRELSLIEISRLESLISTHLEQVKSDYQFTMEGIVKKWDRKINFTELGGRIQDSFVEEILAVDEMYNLTESELINLIEDFRNTRGEFKLLDQILRERMDFEFETINLYTLIRNRMSRIFNQMIKIRELKGIELLEIKSLERSDIADRARWVMEAQLSASESNRLSRLLERIKRY